MSSGTENTPLIVNQPASSIPDQNQPTTEKETESSVFKNIFIGILVLALVFLIYYAYNRFVANSIAEPMTKGLEQERDDPVVDFNLREAIRNLRNMQKNVLSTLSENATLSENIPV